MKATEEVAMSFVIEPAPQVALPVLGTSERFPVRRVYCVGQNYASHAVEMGSDPSRQHPFFFCKAREAVSPGDNFPYPTHSCDVHHEVELVVALQYGGKELSYEQALRAVYGYAVGLDMTRRDLQGEAKKNGRPWEAGKAFDHSAPCSSIVPVTQVGHLDRGEISLKVNGEVRQKGDLDQMIWKVPEILVELSRFFELFPGDLVFTGTPAGVGPVERGDELCASVHGVGEFTVTVI